MALVCTRLHGEIAMCGVGKYFLNFLEMCKVFDSREKIIILLHMDEKYFLRLKCGQIRKSLQVKATHLTISKSIISNKLERRCIMLLLPTFRRIMISQKVAIQKWFHWFVW